jgi:hypothetical protein
METVPIPCFTFVVVCTVNKLLLWHAFFKSHQCLQAWWLTPVILATQKAEIRRIRFKASPGKQFLRPNLENAKHKRRAGEVAKVADPLHSKPETLS